MYKRQDGYIAKLDQIAALADKYGALLMVDDSHAVGFMGKQGRGTPEHFGVTDRVDIITGTLGKALGGASGGYTSGRKEIIQLLRQRSRPYLFSNSVAPPIVAASLKVLDLVSQSEELRIRLRSNTEYFREAMTNAGLWDKTTVLVSSDHPNRMSLEVDGKEDPRVPFLLKLAGQTSSVTYNPVLQTIVTKPLLEAILDRKITTPEDVITWLTTVGQIPGLPSAAVR